MHLKGNYINDKLFMSELLDRHEASETGQEKQSCVNLKRQRFFLWYFVLYKARKIFLLTRM